MSDYIAQRRINPPGMLTAAYQAGDPMQAQVVEDWGLQIPDDVVPADGYQAPRPADDSADRAAWEAYVTGQGTSVDDARAASLDELRGLYDSPPPEEAPAWQVNDAAGPTQVTADNTPGPDPDGDPERPAESARKDEWVDYVITAGADETWARADDTTKAKLIAWTPGGDE